MTDAQIRNKVEGGDLEGAVTDALEAYGDELFGFLVGLTGDHDRAGDVYSAAVERVWKNLAKFRWESSLRAWMYTIARNEFLRGVHKLKRQVPLSAAPSVQALVAKQRTGTAPFQQTAVKERFAKIRDSLDPEDHMLLGLRLDRKLPWNEIATIMEGNAAALRKRYERLKTRLQELAAELRGEE
jgi:RNA polymerase sigma-70 factor (ECF subfamily)